MSTDGTVLVLPQSGGGAAVQLFEFSAEITGGFKTEMFHNLIQSQIG